MVKKLLLMVTTAALVATLSTTTIADTNISSIKTKIAAILPGVTFSTLSPIGKGFYEAVVLEEGNIVTKSVFYTNETVDFIAPSLSLIDENSKISYKKPDFGYRNLDLSKHATFIYGDEGAPKRTTFLNPVSESGSKELKNILAGNDFNNNVFIIFDKDDPVQLLFSLPIFYGDSDNRVAQARETLDLIKKIDDKTIDSIQATKRMEQRIQEMRSDGDKQKTTNLGVRMRAAFELSDIFVPDTHFGIFDAENASITVNNKVVIPQDQVIKSYDFSAQYGADLQLKLSNFKTARDALIEAGMGSNIALPMDLSTTEINKLIEDITVFKVGPDDAANKILLFSDIDCPFCVQLDNILEDKLKPDHQVSVIYFPIQGLHPNALDKSRYILSIADMKERAVQHSLTQGTDTPAKPARQVLTSLSPEILSEVIDPIISKSVALSNLLGVAGTPSVMKIENGVITPLEHAGKILSVASDSL